MSARKAVPFPMIIIAGILIMALLREFDFETLRFRHRALALVYTLALGMALYTIFRSKRKGAEHSD